jgi:hypothetical protein
MAIRTMTQGLTTIARKSSASHPWRGCLLVGAMILLIASTAAADYAAGLTAFNRRDFTRAFSEGIESAKAGDAHAQHGIGMLYETGQGVPYADPKAAADWYQKAAGQNYAPALNNLARLHADGRGVAQDLPKAIELWSRAAEAGNVTARFNLGLQYASGSGVPKDMKKAASYLLQAAESGLPEAQFAVAGFYRDGTGVEKDLEAARQWYERAATAGFEPARAELAALNKPTVGSAPAVETGRASPTAPAEKQQAQKTETSQTETPPQPGSAEPKPAEKPAEGQPQGAAPAETQATVTPAPAVEAKQPEPAQPTEPPAEEASTPQPPVQDKAAPPAEEEANTQTDAQERPAGDGTATTHAPSPDLPVATSLTGDAQVYRIWLYESGQEGDARSYWDKMTMQYPRLLGKLTLDLRRYFLGEARGSLYRVFAGPFEDLGAAQKACEDIRTRFGEQFCRPVLN